MKPRTLRCLSLCMVLSLLLGAAGMTAAAPSPPPPEAEEFQLLDVSSLPAGGSAPFSPLIRGMALLEETEPNDTAANANVLIGTPVVIYGTITAGDYDYFSFYAHAGDRVYAAPQTQWSNVSGDSRLDIMDTDGVTSLEFDDDSGSFSSLASAIGGTIIPVDGTYYVRVYGYGATTVITPYFLHVRVQSGTPMLEVEPNNDLGAATPLPPSAWVSGNISATTDPDLFSFSLNAGDSVYIGLDMDPDRLPTNTNWNGRVGLGLFNNTLLVVNDGSTTKPHAEAFFMTVKEAGTYYAYVDSTSATGLGENARYHLSVSVYPKHEQTNCTTFTSSDVPVAIGPGVGTATSTIVVPGTVTSSITDLNATIFLTHTAMPDLDVTLAGPTGASTPLFTDIGASTFITMDLGLDDQAALPLGTYTILKGMINQPEQPGRLSTFNGLPAGGTWTLQLADDTTNTGGGVLQSWSLEICGDPPVPYDLELTKTVGMEPGVCATTDSIVIPPGGFDVYYCYTVRNTGLNSLATHDLVDSELGTIFTGVSYNLEPGATYSHIQQATIHATVTNTGTWTAQGVTGGVASDSDTATVTVRAQACPAGYTAVTLDSAFFNNPFPPVGWTVTNTSSGCIAPGVPEWTNTNPGNRVNLTGGVGPFAIADSDRCGSGSTLDTIMTTGLLDFTGLMSPTVSFNTDYYDIGSGGDQALVDLSTDGGATWTNLITWDSSHRGPLLVTQDLTGAADMGNVQVRWHYSQGTYDWWWQVDSAFITACEPIPEPPNIDVNPLSLSSTQAPDTTTSQTLTVANTGGEDLEWEMVEEPAVFGGSLSPLALIPFEAAPDDELAGIERKAPTTLAAPDPAARAAARRALMTTGVLLVPDSTNDRVMALDPLTGNVIDPDFVPSNAVIGTGINAILSAGGDSILLSDQTGDVVHEFDLDGNYMGIFAPAGGANTDILDNIRGISLRPNGNLLVTVGSGANANAIAEFDTSGNYLGNFIASGAGGLISPFDIYGRTADWLSGGSSSSAVHRYDSAGAFLDIFAPVSTFPEQIAEAANSNVLVANFSPSTNEGIHEFTSAGVFVGRYDPEGIGGYRGAYELPGGTILTTTGAGVHEIDRSGNLVENKITGISGRFIEYVVLPEAEVCSNPADVPWLSASPISGTTPSGGNTNVTVTLDSTGLMPGTYNANLCIASNDPDEGPGNETSLVIVPVELIVTQILTPSIILTKTVGTVPGMCATTDNITVMEGTEVYYCYQIQNTGNVTLTLHDLVDTELGTLLTAFPYDLVPGALSPQVIVPATLSVTTVNTATWTAYIVGGPTAIATDMARVVVEPSAVSVTGLKASISGAWSSAALLGAFALGGFAWRRRRR